MPYIVLSDVKDAAPQLFNGSANPPSDPQINRAIADIDRLINANLTSIGYQLPIDPNVSPLAFAILQDIEKHGVIGRLINARSFGVDDPTKYGATAALKSFSDRLRQLANPDDPFTLPDAPQNPIVEQNESYASSVVGGATVNDPNAIGGIIDRDTVF